MEWRPKGEKGVVLKFDYEQGIKNLLGGNIDYGRAEFDAQTIFYASRRRSYSMRFGTGFYTMRTAHWDFVDYTNFHNNNIPGGWNDEWTGDFELLSSQWYNASDYYLRANCTYEAHHPVGMDAAGGKIFRERAILHQRTDGEAPYSIHRMGIRTEHPSGITGVLRRLQGTEI